jgi:predicted AlkP superfamily phosphohydrolase/phosphomutase
MYTYLPQVFKDFLLTKIPGKEDRENLINRVRLERTFVIPLDFYLYINDFCISLSKDRVSQELMKNLIKDLLMLKDSGKPVFKTVMRKEDLFYGNKISTAPDLITLPNEGYRIIESVSNRIFEDPKKGKTWIADHTTKGIIVVYGNQFKKGKSIKARIVDIAPTILNLLNVPVPEDFDGRVLYEILETGSSDLRNNKH